jgi:hypothetical protein
MGGRPPRCLVIDDLDHDSPTGGMRSLWRGEPGQRCETEQIVPFDTKVDDTLVGKAASEWTVRVRLNAPFPLAGEGYEAGPNETNASDSQAEKQSPTHQLRLGSFAPLLLQCNALPSDRRSQNSPHVGAQSPKAQSPFSRVTSSHAFICVAGSSNNHLFICTAL